METTWEEKEREREIKSLIDSIHTLAAELKKHSEQISSDKYGGQIYALTRAWSNLEVIRQDYFCSFDYDRALYVEH